MATLFIFMNRRRGVNSRRGAMFVMVAVTLVILFAAAAFSVDVAYMFLAREQLHVATDAAAKAAVVALSQGGSAAQATQKAIDYASYNKVGGQPLTITDNDVKLGRVAYATGGSWAFSLGGTPLTAAKVTAPATVSLFFGRIFGTNTFSPTDMSTAAFVRNKWCFVFDRSGSMCFDFTGTDWSFPAGSWGHGGYWGPPTANRRPPPDWSPSNHPYNYPPQSANSRWASLNNGANIFLSAAAAAPVENRIAMVTFESSSSTDTSSPYFLTSYSPITNKLNYYGSHQMNGGTNIYSGLQRAINLFASTDDGTPWNKVIILFSDGEWNEGSDPLNLISQANNAGITIHTVGLLTNNTTMQQLAIQTGGKHFYVTTGDDLESAFRALAQTIPVILTE
jgi:Ca-activated chloride channel family protein